MAYQNVGTPRFYVDHGLWLHSLGLYSATNPFYTPTHDLSQLSQLNPSSILIRGTNDDYYLKRHAPMNYAAFLGHEHSGLIMYPEFRSADNTNLGINPLTSVVNGQIYSQSSSITYDGFSIFTFPDIPEAEYLRGYMWTDWNSSGVKIGAISLGSTYDMPHSPDLKLTMTREMDGVKKIRTKGGADLVNHKYTKPAMWGTAGAWELYSGTPTNQALSRSGRRVWDLSFSHLQGSDVFGSNQSMGSEAYTTTGYIPITDDPLGDLDANNNFEFNILTDQNFYSQVIHKTNGGQLPFIFQPDKDNNNPINIFAKFFYCKF